MQHNPATSEQPSIALITQENVKEILEKIAIVKPLFKGGTPDSVDWYCPIPTLSCIGSILEKHRLDTITSFVDEYNILPWSQYDLIKGRVHNPRPS